MVSAVIASRSARAADPDPRRCELRELLEQQKQILKALNAPAGRT